MRLCGYTAQVKVVGNIKKAKFEGRSLEMEDQLNGGANALNINRFDFSCRI